jgi:predicted peroxiredoxin
MAELTLVDYFVMGEAVGIVATLFVAFYYSRKQMQKLSVDLETKVLNDRINECIFSYAKLVSCFPSLVPLTIDNYHCRATNVITWSEF